MHKVFMPIHATMLIRPGTGIQFGVLPQHSIILPLPKDIAGGHVIQALSLARRALPTEELRTALTHCGFSDALAGDIIDELLRAGVLLPCLEEQQPIYILETGNSAKYTASALQRLGVPCHLTSNPALARQSVLLTGGEVFLPADVLYEVMSQRIMHFPHGFVDGKLIMGPLVVPGCTPCLACRDSFYATQDSQWHTVRIQASARPMSKNRYDLELAAYSIAHLTHNVLLPWRRGVAPLPAYMSRRRIITPGSFEYQEEDNCQRFHAQCSVCAMVRANGAGVSVRETGVSVGRTRAVTDAVRGMGAETGTATSTGIGAGAGTATDMGAGIATGASRNTNAETETSTGTALERSTETETQRPARTATGAPMARETQSSAQLIQI